MLGIGFNPSAIAARGQGVPVPPPGYVFRTETVAGVTYYLTETVGGTTYYLTEAA